MKIYILTCEYNEYDQFGEYFQAAFKNKPTKEQLKQHVIFDSNQESVINHILQNGGGRKNLEYVWYNLKEYELE
jgi:hypothetical protein